MDRISRRAHFRRYSTPAAALLLLLAPVRLRAAEASVVSAPAALEADAVWEGMVLVGSPLTVPGGVTLTLRPGTELRFRAEAGLRVEGRLVAEGAPGSPVLFAGEGGAAWAGITLANAGEPSRLAECRVLGAQGISVTSGAHTLERCEIGDGAGGVVTTSPEARPVLRGNRFHDLAEGGVRCLGKSAPFVEGNTFERCGPFGVHASQGSAPLILRNTISECVHGIELIQTAPFVGENTVRRCERGIALSSSDGGRPVQRNTVEACKTGIAVQHISSPEIAGNTLAGNGTGVECILGARPLIRGNAIRENETGILCNQLSAPRIEANDLERNRRGIFLTLSSYAIITGNNIVGNEVQMELGNMSRDWERRVGKKPKRGLQQQAVGRAEQGVAGPAGAAEGPDGLQVEGGAVEASGNWWGDATTREMEQKGPDADISGLRDWHDVPTLTYEGYEGEYVQDRIAYAPWAKARIATAGLAPAAPAGAVGP